MLKPFSARRATEIVAAPKVYAFDSGFLCHYRGWDAIRDDDLGVLWEHFVLNELLLEAGGLTSCRVGVAARNIASGEPSAVIMMIGEDRYLNFVIPANADIQLAF